MGPGPIHVIVCNACGQPWEDHMALAEEYSVSFEHCVILLKRANQGPPGPPGPMGPMGAPGRDGDIPPLIGGQGCF